MAMPVKVKKWGSSMAVLIPGQFAKIRKIEVGTVLDLERIDIIEPGRRRYKLSELMSQFKPAHRHGEWQLGEPVGEETW